MAGQNFGDKLVGSIGWLLVGILVFLGSFYLLYKTEGRTDFTTIADKAVEVTNATEQSDFVYVTGTFNTSDLLSDDLYLSEGNYLALERKVEMFAWVEEKVTEDEETYYKYDVNWVDEVADSTSFKEERRHDNPVKPEKSFKKYANSAQIGDYNVDLQKLRMPSLSTLNLTEENTYYSDYAQIISDENSDYIYDGYGSYEDPEIGDLRVSYSVLKPGSKVTAFGRLDGNDLVKHHGEKEKGLYRVFSGIVEDAKANLTGEYEVAGTFGRVGVFIMMWIGLMLILKPLTVSLELIPFIGGLGKGALAVITFTIALILTFIASQLIQNFIYLIIIAAVVIMVAIYFDFKNKQK